MLDLPHILWKLGENMHFGVGLRRLVSKSKTLVRTSGFVSEGDLVSVCQCSWVNPVFLFGYAGECAGKDILLQAGF